MNIEKILESERLAKMLNDEHLQAKAQALKDNLQERINHNSVFANTLLQSIGTNLIDFVHRKEVFRNWDKKACKEAKKEWKSQSPESLLKGRNEILLQLAGSIIPRMNLVIILIK